MKTYREMADSVLRRAAEEREALRRRRRRALLIGVPSLCAALALAVILLPRLGRALPPAASGPAASAQGTEAGQPVSNPNGASGLAAALEALRLPAQTLAAPSFFSAQESPRLLPSELAGIVNANLTVQGRVTGLEAVRVPDGGTTWYLAALTLEVEESLRGSAPSELRVVCAAAYTGTDANDAAAPIPQLAGCREGTDAVFVLRPAKDAVWEIAGQRVRAGALGEYTLVCRLDREGNRLSDPEQGTSVLWVPPTELPASPEGVEADMIGLVVYKGGVYTQAADYFGAEADALQGLIGERLGEASGNIDEWSGQDAYAQEFASTVAGAVCSVNGYSPDFRICVTGQPQDENSAPMRRIQLLERLNGVALGTGAELITERLRLDGRITGARFQSFDDWNNGRGNLHPLEDMSLLDPFLEALKRESFREAAYDDPGFAQPRVLLYLDLEDGLTAAFHLFENGRVVYLGPMGWAYLQVPAEAFDPLFRASAG